MSTIGQESMATRDEIMDFRERLAVAFERDDANTWIVVSWKDADAPEDDPIGTWQDDGGREWQEDAYPTDFCRFDSDPSLTAGRWSR